MSHRADSRRTITDNPIKFFPQLLYDFGDSVFGQRVFVASLRRRKQVQSLQTFVANERLRKLRHTVDDVDQIKDYTSLSAKH